MKKISILASCSLALLLAACGGGLFETTAPPLATDAVPETASQTPLGLTSYLTELTVAAADDKDPLDLSKFSPAQPDDTEPEALK